ncbi:hypothetical protein H312_01740 [Anncaliia algerae PRA339]|uniref:DNA-directed RNA polymerase I subunit RPA12 n=1 Tax=Anncaliia algerae PRA339 TaxID=1288291 RepID=A0A059F174_9MICR|nr:hypothetical protein H312_01740 [Anncaliia algerae PRA339]
MFCSCGSVLLIPSKEESICNLCKKEYKFKKSTIRVVKYYKNSLKKEEDTIDPIINRSCEQCGSKEMTFKSVQLRSTDEGQTIYYTCTKCKFKTTVHS